MALGGGPRNDGKLLSDDIVQTQGRSMTLTPEDLDHIEARALCEGDAALPYSANYLDAVKPEVVLELARLARAGLFAEKHLRLMQARRPVPGRPLVILDP